MLFRFGTHPLTILVPFLLLHETDALNLASQTIFTNENEIFLTYVQIRTSIRSYHIYLNTEYSSLHRNLSETNSFRTLVRNKIWVDYETNKIFEILILRQQFTLPHFSFFSISPTPHPFRYLIKFYTGECIQNILK